MENIRLILEIIVAILALILIVVSRNKSKKIAALEEKNSTYYGIFRKPSDLFSFATINTHLSQLQLKENIRTNLKGLNDKELCVLQEFFVLQKASQFERMIRHLRPEAESLDRVVDFDYSFMKKSLSDIRFERDELLSKVMEFWKFYLDPIDTSLEMMSALNYVKNNPFFPFYIDPSLAPLKIVREEWFTIWEENLFQILEKEQKQLKKTAEVAWTNKEFATLFELVKKIALINKNEFLKSEHRDVLLKNVKVFFRQCVELFYKESGREVSLDITKMYVDLVIINNELYPVPSPVTA